MVRKFRSEKVRHIKMQPEKAAFVEGMAERRGSNGMMPSLVVPVYVWSARYQEGR